MLGADELNAVAGAQVGERVVRRHRRAHLRPRAAVDPDPAPCPDDPDADRHLGRGDECEGQVLVVILARDIDRAFHGEAADRTSDVALQRCVVRHPAALDAVIEGGCRQLARAGGLRRRAGGRVDVEGGELGGDVGAAGHGDAEGEDERSGQEPGRSVHSGRIAVSRRGRLPDVSTDEQARIGPAGRPSSCACNPERGGVTDPRTSTRAS